MSINAEIRQLMRYKLVYSMTGLVLGLAGMLGGIVLFLYGVTGTSSWTAKILGTESTLTDAAPGAVLFIVGLFIVIATRFTMKIDYESETEHGGDDAEHQESPESGTPTEKTRTHVKTTVKAKTRAAVKRRVKVRAKAAAKKR